MRRMVFGVLALLGCAQRERERVGAAAQAVFTDTTYLPTPRSSGALLTLPSGDALLVGGYDGTAYVSSIDLWTQSTGLWSKPATGPFEFSLPSAVTLADGKVLVVGSGGAIVYDPAAKLVTFQTTTERSRGTTTTLLSTGKVLLAGGVLETTGYAPPRLFDPATKTFSPAGTMATLRVSHGVVPLADGVLVVGGANYALGSPYFSSVERYSTATNAWSPKASMSVPRSDAVVVGLPTGKVLAAGGDGGAIESSAELYDPAADTWTALPAMPGPREGAAAAVLPSGRVLVVGGYDGEGPLATTLLFDPTTLTWTAGPKTKVAHRYAAITRLAGGRVMVLGGISAYAADGGAEVFTNAVEIFGGLAAGASCVVAEECVSGACTGGTCSGAVDAGVESGPDAAKDSSTVDTGTPLDTGTPDTGTSFDATPPDHGTPVVSGEVQRCRGATECPTGFCVDGVCCDSKCDAPCHSCVLPGSPGVCSLEPFGIDHANACGKAGTCVGTCDGKGGCTSATGGAQCEPSRCTGTSTGAAAAFCSASGSSCDERALAFECAPFACDQAFGACLSACKTSLDCADGFVCDTGSRSCVSQPPEDTGGCVFAAPSARHGAAPILALAVAAFWRRKRRRSGAQ